MYADLLGNILEVQRYGIFAAAFQKILLEFNDRIDRIVNGFSALLDAFQHPNRSIEFFFDVILGGRINLHPLLYQILVVVVYQYLWDIPLIQKNGPFAIQKLNGDIGSNILHTAATAPGLSRSGVQSTDGLHQLIDGIYGQLHLLCNLRDTICRHHIEVIVDDGLTFLVVGILVVQLKDQAILQIHTADTGRIKAADQRQDLIDFGEGQAQLLGNGGGQR